MLSFDWVRQRERESTIMRLAADRDKWKPFLVIELVGQCKIVDLSAERRACCGTKMKAVGGFNRSLNPTSSSKEEQKPASFYEHYSIFDTSLYGVILLLNSIRQFFNYSREKNSCQTQWDFFLSIHTSLNQTIFSDTVNLNVNLEPGVLDELIGEPLSTTEHSSILAIYSILLLNSKNALQWQFLTTAIISVFSQKLKVKCSKCRR